MPKKHLKLKTGDTVKVMRGKNSGKSGKISQVFPSVQKIVVDGINKTIKHLKPTKKGEKGQRVEFFAPIAASTVALLCPKCQKPTRVGYHLSKGEDGSLHKARECKKCHETF